MNHNENGKCFRLVFMLPYSFSERSKILVLARVLGYSLKLLAKTEVNPGFGLKPVLGLD